MKDTIYITIPASIVLILSRLANQLGAPTCGSKTLFGSAGFILASVVVNLLPDLESREAQRFHGEPFSVLEFIVRLFVGSFVLTFIFS